MVQEIARAPLVRYMTFPKFMIWLLYGFCHQPVSLIPIQIPLPPNTVFHKLEIYITTGLLYGENLPLFEEIRS
jgi:hypothetical protein